MIERLIIVLMIGGGLSGLAAVIFAVLEWREPPLSPHHAFYAMAMWRFAHIAVVMLAAAWVLGG